MFWVRLNPYIENLINSLSIYARTPQHRPRVNRPKNFVLDFFLKEWDVYLQPKVIGKLKQSNEFFSPDIADSAGRGVCQELDTSSIIAVFLSIKNGLYLHITHVSDLFCKYHVACLSIFDPLYNQ